MTITAFRALGVGAALILLAGCGGSLGAGGQSSLLAPQSTRTSLHGNSLIGPAARGKALLYATSVYNCDAYVFSYPRGIFGQTINVCMLGFGPAFGLCTNRSGDVFMAMAEGFSVFEFAHGDTQPIAQLRDDSLLPVGCSVDPKTGDLGVASATGNVAIFKNASGTPQIYSLANVTEFFFCTFDDRGNLFADGEHNDGSFALAELPKGSSALREITVSGNFGIGLALQWDGRHIAIGQTQASNDFILDRIRVSGSAAKIVGTTTLTSTLNSFTPFQFWIQGSTIVQPENGNEEIGLWNYPGGGAQTKGIQIKGSTLVGVTVSVAPHHR
jgi:hypothetical protein